jgi:hypothetical protein
MASAQKGLATIDEFLSMVGGTEKAAASPLSEPGSQGGETKHPVKNVDDRLEVAKEGERSSENSSDVKEDQGAPSVDSTPEAKAATDSLLSRANRFAAGSQKRAEGGAVSNPGSAADDQLQIGTNKQPTGEDPKNETSSAKAGKEDPGSKHPARTDNDALDGHKYANASLDELAQITKQAGDTLLATLAAMGQNTTPSRQTAHQPQQPAAKQASHHDAEKEAWIAAQAGWEMASLVTGRGFDKKASDSLVHSTILSIVKQASDDAGRYINCHAGIKQAEGEEGPPAGEGGPPPGEGGGGEEDAMLAALGGGADAGGMPGGGMGGPPPGPGGPGGEGGGDDVAQLAQLLAQLGITPEELQAAMADETGGEGGMPGGGPGGPPPGAGGPPPGMGGPPPGGMGGGGGPPPGGPPGGGMPPGMEVAASDEMLKKATRDYIYELLKRSRKN